MEAVEVEVEVEENPGKQSSNSFIKIEHIEGVYNLLLILTLISSCPIYILLSSLTNKLYTPSIVL